MSNYHRPMLVVRISMVAALALIVGACSSASSGSDRPSLVPSSEQPSQLPGPSGSAAPGPINLPASIVGPVLAEIARVAGVPVDQVIVRSAQSVTFPDGGLGCPVPGMVYTQVLVDGFKLVAEAGGKTYDYRGTGPDSFRPCQNPAS